MAELPDFDITLAEKIEWMVQTKGYAIEPVAPDAAAAPPRAGYTYTIGVPALTAFPDIVVFGLTPVASSGLLDLVVDALRGGIEIPLGVELVGLLDNELRCVLAPLDGTLAAQLCPNAAAYYGVATIEMVQLLYPDRQGFLPYEQGFDHRLRFAQPVFATFEA